MILTPARGHEFSLILKKTPMTKNTQEIVAKHESDWWELIRKDLGEWNRKAHPEDRLTLLDYLGELVGAGPVYGFVVTVADYTRSGYRVTRVNT
jgi:hypothetical protein